jgi:hypothetical protein
LVIAERSKVKGQRLKEKGVRQKIEGQKEELETGPSMAKRSEMSV